MKKIIEKLKNFAEKENMVPWPDEHQEENSLAFTSKFNYGRRGEVIELIVRFTVNEKEDISVDISHIFNDYSEIRVNSIINPFENEKEFDRLYMKVALKANLIIFNK